jgi:hypothetical protein
MGAATGNQRGTEGMPEVQKPVLEYAPTEAQNPQVTDDILTQNTTAATDDLQGPNVRKTDDYYCHYRMGINFQTGKLLWMTDPSTVWLNSFQ